MFVEVKGPNENPEGLQARELNNLNDRGFIVAVVHSREEVDTLIANVMSSQEYLKILYKDKKLHTEG